MGHKTIQAATVGAALFGLSGCIADTKTGTYLAETKTGEFVSRLVTPGSEAASAAEDGTASTQGYASTRTNYDNTLNQESEIINGLVARRSVIPNGSAYDDVVSAVLAANSRAAESELRSARLRAEAASKNWLPTIGPSLSLSSLSDVVVSLVVDQVLFDNGRKKGEREFAKADVEVAAVALAKDTNTRAATGLGLYLAAAAGREKAALASQALKDMSHFEYVMSERVRGGVSDMSDLNIIRQKLSEIRASHLAAEETTRSAIAELNAMSLTPLQDVRGIVDLDITSADAQPLDVTKAQAEKTRAIAAAKIDRANQLPGVNLTASLGDSSSIGVNAGGTQLGLGTRAQLKAIKAATETSERRVAQSREEANRKLRKLESQIAAKTRQAQEARKITDDAKINLDLFQAQYKSGHRQVIDVASVYETFARVQQKEVTLKYELAKLQIEMANLLGVLVNGEDI